MSNENEIESRMKIRFSRNFNEYEIKQICKEIPLKIISPWKKSLINN